MPLTVAQLVARVTADTSGFYRSMAVANSAMIRSGGIIKRVGAGMSLALLGTGIAAARVAGNFEESMNMLKAVIDPSAAQFKALRDQAIALGKDMKLPGVSAQDAATAMTQLAKAGLSVKDIQGGVRGTLQLATAANIDFGESATIVARSLKAFGLEGKDATRIADLFAAAAATSTAEMSDIALAFQQASGNFDMANQSIETLTASIAIMADKGVIGSDAGTSLKTMMQRLFAPTAKAAKIMKGLGIDVTDSSGKIKDMRAIIKEFEVAFAGMTDAKKAKLLGQIFGSDAIRSANRILLGGVKNWDKYSKNVEKTGMANKLSEARMKGFNGALRQFLNVVETLAIQIGSAMLPVLTRIVRAVANFVDGFNPQPIIDFFTRIKDGVVAIYEFIRNSDTAQAALAALLAGFLAFRAVSTIIDIFRQIGAAWRVLSALFITSPLGLVIAAIAGLAAGLYILYQRSETVRNAINKAWSQLKSFLIPIFESIKDKAIETWQGIKAAVMPVVTSIQRFIQTHMETIKSIMTRIWGAIKAVVGGFINGLATTIRAAMGVIKGVIQTIMGVISGDWSKAWNGIKGVFSSVWNGIKDLFQNIWNTMNNLTNNALGRIVRAVTDFMGKAKNKIVEIWNKVVEFFTSLPGKMKGLAVSIGKAIVSGIVNGLGGIANAVYNKVKGGISDALGKVKGFFGIGSPSKVFADELGKPLAQGVIKGWLLGSATLPDTMKETLRNSIEKAREVIDKGRSSLSDAMSRLAGDVMSAFDARTRETLTPAEKALAEFIGAKEAADAQKAVDEANKALTEAQNALNAFTGADMEPADAAAERARLTQAVVDAQERIANLAWEKQRADMEAQAAAERKEFDARRELQKRHLQDRLDDLLASLSKEGATAAEAQRAITKLLKSFGIDYKTAGMDLGIAFAQGLRESAKDVEKAARFIANLVAKYLKLKSPAEKGPMSDLNHWWDSMGGMLTKSAGLGKVMSDVRSQLRGSGGVGTYAGTRPGTIVQNVYVEGSVVTERQVAMRTRELLLRERNRLPELGMA